MPAEDVPRETQRAAHSGVDLVVLCGQAGQTSPKALFLLNAFTHHHRNGEIVYFFGTRDERC